MYKCKAHCLAILQLDKHNLVAVGPNSPTVSPGGYTMGGGHGPLTRKLGLAVDNVIEFQIVTTDGSIVTVTYGGTWKNGGGGCCANKHLGNFRRNFTVRALGKSQTDTFGVTAALYIL